MKMDTLNVYNWVNSTQKKKKLCTFDVQILESTGADLGADSGEGAMWQLDNF